MRAEQSSRLRCIHRDQLKYLALIVMTAGHVAGYLTDWENGSYQSHILSTFLSYFSVFAPPIFFFMLGEGFRYTRSRKKYALRLFLFACITQIPYGLAVFGTLCTVDVLRDLNVFFTLFLGLIALAVWESEKPLPMRLLLIALLDLLTWLIHSEWMIFGIPLIIILHVFRDQPKKRLLSYAGILLVMIPIYSSLAWQLACIMGAAFALSYCCFTLLYNGKKGRFPNFSKWFFYIYYPLHLTVIWLCELYLQRW